MASTPGASTGTTTGKSGVPQRYSLGLDNILSPDVAKQLYEITEGAKRRPRGTNTVSRLQQETSPIQCLQLKEKEKKKSPVSNATEIQNRIDKLLKSTKKDHTMIPAREKTTNREALDFSSFLDRSVGTADVGKFEFEQYILSQKNIDSALVQDSSVLKFNDSVVIQSVVNSLCLRSSSNSINIDGNYTDEDSNLRLLLSPLAKASASKENVIKFGDEILIFHEVSGQFLHLGSSGELSFSKKRAGKENIWKIKLAGSSSSGSYFSNQGLDSRNYIEYQQRENLFQEAAASDRSFLKRVTKEEACSISVRSSNVFALQNAAYPKSWLCFSNNLLQIYSDEEFDSTFDKKLVESISWRVLKTSTTQSQGFANMNDTEFRPFNNVSNVAFFQRPVFSLPEDLSEQQAIVIESLLFSMSGVESTLFSLSISPDASSSSFTKFRTKNNDSVYLAYPRIQEHNQPRQSSNYFICNKAGHRLDPALKELASKILVLANYYLDVTTFVNYFREGCFGLIVSGLIEKLDYQLSQYGLFVARIEHMFIGKDLNLIKMYSIVQPMIQVMECLSETCSACAFKKGGALLNAIASQLSRYQYNEKEKKILDGIYTHCSNIYFKFVKLWIFYGVVDDRFDEFFIEQSSAVKKTDLLEDFNATYWDEKFKLRQALGDDNIPLFLRKQAKTILQTGKYLNVAMDTEEMKSPTGFTAIIQPSNKSHFDQFEFNLSTTSDELLSQTIQDAFEQASTKLLQLLIIDYKLMTFLNLLKDYLLLFNGEFTNNFFECAEGCLDISVANSSIRALNDILETALRVEPSNRIAGNFDQAIESFFTIQLMPLTLADHVAEIHGKTGVLKDQEPGNLKTFMSIVFDCRINWPTSLILSKQAITKYQLLFRLIFFIKFVERKLKYRTVSATEGSKESSSSRKLYIKHNKMRHFISNFLYYVMFEVIEIKFKALQDQINIMTAPEQTDQKSQKIQTVEDLITLHNDFMDSVLNECLLTHHSLLSKVFSLLDKILVDSDDFSRDFEQFVRLLASEAENNRYFYLENLCTRLDYNGFFKMYES